MKKIEKAKIVRTTLIFLSLLVGLSSCLKTRAQLREDSEGGGPEEAQETPAPPTQEVHPHGPYVIDEMRAEITRLTGKIEDVEHQMSQAKSDDPQALPQALKEEIRKLEERVLQLEQGHSEVLERMAHLATAPSKSHVKAAVKSPEEMTFAQAESFFNAKDYKKAIVEYSKFPEKFSHSRHMPVVLYKIGLSFDALGMKDDAHGFYQELVEKFPKSPEAAQAKAKKKVKA